MRLTLTLAGIEKRCEGCGEPLEVAEQERLLMVGAPGDLVIDQG